MDLDKELLLRVVERRRKGGVLDDDDARVVLVHKLQFDRLRRLGRPLGYEARPQLLALALDLGGLAHLVRKDVAPGAFDDEGRCGLERVVAALLGDAARRDGCREDGCT